MNLNVQPALTTRAAMRVGRISTVALMLSLWLGTRGTHSVALWVRDAFGNLARPAAALTLTNTGVGTLATTARVASFLKDVKPIGISSSVTTGAAESPQGRKRSGSILDCRFARFQSPR